MILSLLRSPGLASGRLPQSPWRILRKLKESTSRSPTVSSLNSRPNLPQLHTSWRLLTSLWRNNLGRRSAETFRGESVRNPCLSGLLGLGGLGAYSLALLSRNRALCEEFDTKKQNRVQAFRDAQTRITGTGNLSFDWRLFFKFLWPDSLLLLAAVVVFFYSIYFFSIQKFI
jgi:hypothetical protein